MIKIISFILFFSSFCIAESASLPKQEEAPRIIEEVSLMVSGAEEGHFVPAIERFKNIFRTHKQIKVGSLSVVGDPYSITEKVYASLNPGELSTEFKQRIINKVMIPKPDNLTEEEDNIFSSSIADGMQEIMMTDPEMKLFFDIGGQLSIVQELPKELHIEKSPAWLFKTNKGNIIVEGVLEPENFINQKNEFVDKGVLDEADKEETLGAETNVMN